MQRHLPLLAFGIVLVSLPPLAAGAEVTLGQPAPPIAAADWLNTNANVSLDALRGKIVVAEFWATWCPPCRTSIPHLNELHETWGPRGVVIIGMTDESKAKVTTFMRSTPMHYIVGVGSRTGGRYGVRGIPHAFVIDPQGKLVWEGHPMSGLDEALRETYQNTPPTLISAAQVKKLGGALVAAEKQFQKQSYASALSTAQEALAVLPATHELYARAEALQGRIVAAGQVELDRSAALLEADQPVEAAKLLARARRWFKGSDVGEQAAEQLGQLKRDPQIAAAIEAAEAEEAARAAEEQAAQGLEAAEARLAEQDYVGAYAALTRIAERYARTEAGKTAAEKVEQLMADPELAAVINDAAAKKDCCGWLNMARNYRTINRSDKAEAFYQQIIDSYPDSSYAQQAREELAALQQ